MKSDKRSWIQRLKELAWLAVFLLVAGIVVVVSGIAPIEASSGHWPITHWFLKFASTRAVAFHSMGVETPDLDRAGLIELGAASYEMNCRWCHGSPLERRPPVPIGSTPTPPYLPETVERWEPRELFYIVKHGIKFTGMPAWPALQRDDEIWAVVAFLRKLPEMTAESYQTSIEMEDASEDPTPRQLAVRCGVCHRADGSENPSDQVPKLNAQSGDYLAAELRAYKAGQRHSGVMQPIAARLTEADIVRLAEYYSSKPDNVKPTEMPERDTRLDDESATTNAVNAQELIYFGNQRLKIPACAECHGPGESQLHAEYPRLSGQPARFIESQLELFANRQRGGDAQAKIMHPIADKLKAEQRHAIAVWYAALKDD